MALTNHARRCIQSRANDVEYPEFFKQLTGHTPHPYQERLAHGAWPEVIDVPTGLGKTDAVVVAWLYRRFRSDPGTGRRLVYCLPMRVLVEQTVRVAQDRCSRAADFFVSRDLTPPSVHAMLGGFVDEQWETKPEAPAVLVGTQDMLLSRALCRGYAMSRYRWPIHFGLLHNDCLWVFDETQLMGVGVETSAQLEGLRQRLGTLGPTGTVWMSATLGRAQLSTVDHPEPSRRYAVVALGEKDRASAVVRQRTSATKPLTRGQVSLSKMGADRYAESVAALAAAAHTERGGLTLVIVNRVQRAQDVFRALRARQVEPVALVHSRFRSADRHRHERALSGDGARVVVATQAIEAGVDVSARTLITELAPWPSLVQRLGRCNRYGGDDQARAVWLDLEVESDEEMARPYEASELVQARALLEGLEDGGPDKLAGVTYAPAQVVRPVLRRRDLLDLFDTTPDLFGNDIDVSRFVRDGDDTDVLVYWRAFEDAPDPGMTAPTREESVRVSVGAARDFLEKLKKKRQSLGDTERDRQRKKSLSMWALNPLGTKTPWERVAAVRPGQVVLLHVAAGGYDSALGWTGEVMPSRPVEEIEPEAAGLALSELIDSDPETSLNRWVGLSLHLSDVAREAAELSRGLGLAEGARRAVTTAALWHDVGKAHAEFQRRIVEPVRDDPELAPPGLGPWAKSGHAKRPPADARPHFRHELASALAWLQLNPQSADHDLVAFLIAAHHGKVRLSIRSVPDERRPPEEGRLFARGIWQGDTLPAVRLSDGTAVGPVDLDLTPMQLGEGSWLERTLALRDDPTLGPFRLSFLEAVVRIADWRASEKERRDG